VTIVQNKVFNAAGEPIAGAYVPISLSIPGYLSDGTIVAPITVVTDVNGLWQADLVPNDDISPEGTYYRVSESGVLSFISVPSGGTPPFEMTDLLVTTPENPGEVVSGVVSVDGRVGAVSLSDLYTTEAYADAGDALRVAKAGDTMTGALQMDYNGFELDVARDLSIASSTGVAYTSGPITQASSTSVSIPAGVAVFSHHNFTEQSFTAVEYGPATVTIDDLSDPLTYLMVSDTGAIVQNDGVPTRAQRRNFAILGRAVVIAGAIVSVQDSPILATHPLSFAFDMLNAIGDIRVDGIRAAAISSTLTFSLTAGNIFNPGANYQNDEDDPNVTTFNAVSPTSFRYVTQSGVVGTARTTIDPSIYDVGGVVTAVGGGAGSSTIQRVHCFPTQNVFIQLGQTVYSSLAAAVDALSVGDTPGFTTHPDLRGGGVRTAFIVCTRTATNLADTAQARVLRATRFGDPGGL
jgi:hypothetical protein